MRGKRYNKRMIALYRRHILSCPHVAAGRKYRRCSCPIHVDGTLAGKPVKAHSLKTSNWTLATARVRQWEAQGYIDAPDTGDRITVSDAVNTFMKYLRENRNAKPQTIYLYECVFMERKPRNPRKKLQTLEGMCAARGIRYAEQITLSDLEALQAEWKIAAPLTRYNSTVHIKTLWSYLAKRKMVSADVAADLPLPDTDGTEKTQPFTQAEMIEIFRAARVAGHADYALVMLLRYSGLRISDSITRPCSSLTGARLTLRQMKTGGYVTTLLPQAAVDALAQCPRESPAYWFWTGPLRGATQEEYVQEYRRIKNKWSRRLTKVFLAAGIPHGHPHMLRDTFAVENILADMPIDEISRLLGHGNIRTTEKHYLPWIAARQSKMEATQQRVWNADPVLAHLSNEAYAPDTQDLAIPATAVN